MAATVRLTEAVTVAVTNDTTRRMVVRQQIINWRIAWHDARREAERERYGESWAGLFPDNRNQPLSGFDGQGTSELNGLENYGPTIQEQKCSEER